MYTGIHYPSDRFGSAEIEYGYKHHDRSDEIHEAVDDHAQVDILFPPNRITDG